ncbi:DNA-binding transcriptional regulator YhcF (GntR family) [Paenibacillus castaneae]|uniref:helix-turn-helix domain-containing protein n=1 Tax=Paenibacillus castaneae TaxID=474957 RepID=UPI00141B8155|nr:helix-turn-helix domain-containing protein [Paenibacillus castaneae]NIK80543.1 DNA-binding transcriptional regulator YhcF (GntR family) [Paenibacillus castaneae]
MNELVDPKTGEMVKVFIPFEKLKHRRGFFMADQDGMVALAKLDLKGRTKDVLLYILGKIDYENWLLINQVQIAEDLGMKPPHVSRAFKELENKRIIFKVQFLTGTRWGHKVKGDESKRWAFRVDPVYAWKGKASTRTTALQKVSRMKTRKMAEEIEV